MRFFSVMDDSIIHTKVKKKPEAPHHCCHLTSMDNALSAAKAGSAVYLSIGRLGALKPPHPQTALLGPSLPDTSGWPQASFLDSWGPLCSSSRSVFPAYFSPLSQRPGGPGFCFLSDTLPCGLLQMNPVGRQRNESIKNVSSRS